MSKMHLCARVPNEGARKLAQWLLDDPARTDALCDAALIDRPTIDRLLAGEMLPGLEIGAPIERATRGVVTARDWYRDATVWWFDRADVPMRRAA